MISLEGLACAEPIGKAVVHDAVSAISRRARRLRPMLDLMVEREASDLLLVVGERPRLRVAGELVVVDTADVLSDREIVDLTDSVLGDGDKQAFETERELDFAFDVPGLSRFRGNVYRQRETTVLVLRRVPDDIPSLAELGVPLAVEELVNLSNGLVLITGPAGSGKSTTLAALIDKLNHERTGHILTVEDPIEFVHQHHGCLVSQREVGSDTVSFAHALRRALRQTPDYLLIGELRDLDTISAALTMAETGHLTFSTLHTKSAPDAVTRIIDVFPAEQQYQIRTQLAGVLEAVVTQALVPRADRAGRALACEVMICTPAIRTLIRENKIHQAHSVIQSSRGCGMQTLNDSLLGLYRDEKVSRQQCLEYSNDRESLECALT